MLPHHRSDIITLRHYAIISLRTYAFPRMFAVEYARIHIAIGYESAIVT